MIKKRIIGLLLALAAVFGLGLGTALQAQAATDFKDCHTYGGKIFNDAGSTKGITVWGSGLTSTGCGGNAVNPGRWSDWNYNTRDVDKFYVGPAFVCTSQWGHNYYEGWYTLVDDKVVLSLYCRLTGV